MRRGWCPTVHAPMPTGDGLLVRVHPLGKLLFGAQAALLADMAARLGNGVIELTVRANLQFRGLTAASAIRFAREAVEHGLASADPEVEARDGLLFPPPLEGGDGGGVQHRARPVGTEFHPSPRPSPSRGEGEGLLRTCRSGATPPPAPLARGGEKEVFIPFGRMTAATLAALAPHGPLRLCADRAILLPPGTVLDPVPPGIILDPGDPRLRVTACVGRPGCASASVDTLADAARLAAARPRRRIHLSGCGKRCGVPATAEIVLVGDDGIYRRAHP